LRYQGTDPGLDVRRIVHILITADNVDVGDPDVLHRRVFKILAQTAYGHTVSAVTCCILDVNVERARFDGHAIISTLIDEVGEPDVVRVHGVCIVLVSNSRHISDMQYTDIPKPSVF
jgi:hypothetical protein